MHYTGKLPFTLAIPSIGFAITADYDDPETEIYDQVASWFPSNENLSRALWQHIGGWHITDSRHGIHKAAEVWDDDKLGIIAERGLAVPVASNIGTTFDGEDFDEIAVTMPITGRVIKTFMVKAEAGYAARRRLLRTHGFEYTNWELLD